MVSFGIKSGYPLDTTRIPAQDTPQDPPLYMKMAGSPRYTPRIPPEYAIRVPRPQIR